MQPSQTVRAQALLFDMDGVLVASTGGDERTWLRWAALRGMAEFNLRATHGRRTIDTVRELRPDLDAAAEVRLLEDFDAENADGLRALPGVVALLAALPPDRWAIVTSASERLMRNRLAAVGVPVPRILVTADHVQNGKPHPEPYAMGARLLGADPARCVVVEDAPAGLQSASQAGCRVMGLLTSHRADELRGADWIVPDLARVAFTACDGDDLVLRIDCSAG